MPLTALRAFEATARLGSLTRAAAELGVTHAAISHQLRVLEEFVGVDLFHRVGRRVELSDPGHMLLPPLNDAFRHIHGSIDEVSKRPRSSAVELVVPPVFAARWLLPRLGRFRAWHDDCPVHVTPSRVPVAPTTRRGSRLVVACGAGEWRGANLHLLLPIMLEPICAPQTAREYKLKAPADLARARLLDTDLDPDAGPGADWLAWMAAAGLDDIEIAEHEALRDAGLAVQAALDGLGVVLGDHNLCTAELDDGRLCAPLGVRYRHHFSYWLLSSLHGLDDSTSALYEWLLAEAARSPNPAYAEDSGD